MFLITDEEEYDGDVDQAAEDDDEDATDDYCDAQEHFLSPVEPSSPNPGCPSGYIRDGFPLSCTCSLSTPGTPAARPVWSHDSAGGASFTKTVTSQDNGDNFTCQAKWGDRVIKQTSYTLRVACELFD